MSIFKDIGSHFFPSFCIISWLLLVTLLLLCCGAPFNHNRDNIMKTLIYNLSSSLVESQIEFSESVQMEIIESQIGYFWFECWSHVFMFDTQCMTFDEVFVLHRFFLAGPHLASNGTDFSIPSLNPLVPVLWIDTDMIPCVCLCLGKSKHLWSINTRALSGLLSFL